MAEKVGEASVVISAVDKATEVIRGVTGQFDTLGSKWGKLVGALGVGAGFTALTALVKQSVEAADRMGELAAATGTSAKFLESMQLIVKTSGTDMEAFAKSLVKLGSVMETAVDDPTSKAAVTFRNLGIAIKDTSGHIKSQEELILDLADAYTEADDKQRFATMGAQSLGKQWIILAPIIAAGREEIQKSMELAKQLGLVLRDEDREAMGAFADTIEVMKMSSQGFGNVLATELMPTLSALAQLWLDNSKEATSFSSVIATVVTVAFKGLVSAAMASWDILKAVGTTLGGLFASIATRSMAPFNEALTDANKIMADGKKRIDDLWSNSLPQLSTAALAAGRAARTLGTETTGAAKAAQTLAEQQAKAREALLADVSALELNAGAAVKLNEAQALMLKVGEAIAAGKVKLSQAEAVEIFNRLKLVDATIRADAALKQMSDIYTKAMEDQEKSAEAVQAQVAEQIRYNETLGLSKAALVEYAIAEKEVRIAQLERIESTEGLTTAQRAELGNLKLLIELMRKGELTAASVDAAEASRKAWEDTARDIQQALTDALVQGFEGGKSVVRSIGDYIVNYFRTVIARGIAQALVGAMAAGLGGIAQAGGGGGGGFGGGGGSMGSSALSMGSSLFGGSGGMASGLMESLGMGSLVGGGMSGFGLGVGSGVMGAFSGAAGEGASLAAAGFGAEGAGMMLGAAMPYVAIAYALYRIISGVGTGRMRGPAWQQWATSPSAEGIYGSITRNPALGGAGYYQQQITQLTDAVSQTARALGGSANAGTAYGIYSSTGTEGSGSYGRQDVIGAAGQLLFSYGANYGSQQDMITALGAQIPNMILAGLKDADLPKQIKSFFNAAAGVDAETLTAMIQTAQAVESMAHAFEDLGGPFAQLVDLSVEARLAIADLTGGMDAFAQKAAAYYQQFYSPEEQQALALVQAQKILQEAGIDTSALSSRAAYRSGVEGLDLSTPEGQARFAAYLNAAGAFASGADLLAMSGMSLAQFTQDAPQLNDGIASIASAQQDSTAVLVDIRQVLAEGFSVMAERGINVDVTVNAPASVEVGWVNNGGN